MKKSLFFVVLLMFFATIFGAYWIFNSFVGSPASEKKQEVVYEVNPGKSFLTIAKELERIGLIRNANLFSIFARVRGDGKNIKVGEYALKTDMTPGQILDVLISGKSIGRNLTIAEGLNIFEIAELLEKSGIAKKSDFLKLVTDPLFILSVLHEKAPSLEGYLFPETYQVTKYTELKTLVQNMVQKFLDTYSAYDDDAKNKGWSRHQVITLASIIEKETGAPEERSMISSVFHNRLRKGMLLQTDPTILYAKSLSIGNIVPIVISRADLRFESPYNTYLRKGLPPGPIANPGKAAIAAALSPEPSEYLYFVSQNNGTHIFSKEYKDHASAVKKFQLDAKAREGKSWKDLKKNRTKENLQGH